MQVYRSTREKKQEFLRLISNGLSPRDAGLQVGVQRAQRMRWLDEAGITSYDLRNITVSPKILFYDFEMLPNRGYFFETKSDFAIPLDFIDKQKSICSIAYKFLGDTDVRSISISDYPFTDAYDDKAILSAFLPVWNSADYLVAHNGDNFDMKAFSARLIANGLPSCAPVASLDTYKLAKGKFGRMLNSNKLDHLAEVLGVEQKIKTSAKLWVQCAKGDIQALKEMAIYNQQDVTVLEQVFVKLLPHVQSKLNWNLFVEQPVKHCKQCGSDNLTLNGYHYTAATIRHRFVCNSCHGWSIFSGKR